MAVDTMVVSIAASIIVIISAARIHGRSGPGSGSLDGAGDACGGHSDMREGACFTVVAGASPGHAGVRHVEV
ncbi:MAG: hypothetical protein AMXMBFR42_14760 [Burkholderiales bacterium]